MIRSCSAPRLSAAQTKARPPASSGPAGRVGRVSRETKETKLLVELDLDGPGPVEVETGVPFFDHMLNQLGKHGCLGLTVHTRGDIDRRQARARGPLDPVTGTGDEHIVAFRTQRPRHRHQRENMPGTGRSHYQHPHPADPN